MSPLSLFSFSCHQRSARRLVPQPGVGRQRAPAVGSLCSQACLCPARGPVLLVALLTRPWAPREAGWLGGVGTEWRAQEVLEVSSPRRKPVCPEWAVADATLLMPPHPGRDHKRVRSSPQAPVEVPAASPKQCGSSASCRAAAGQVLGTSAQSALSLQLLGVFWGFVVIFSCSGLRAAPVGPWQLREVDMFTSKELLLIKHQ